MKTVQKKKKNSEILDDLLRYILHGGKPQVENTLLDLHNSSYLTQPRSLIAKFFAKLHLIEDDVVFGITVFP